MTDPSQSDFDELQDIFGPEELDPELAECLYQEKYGVKLCHPLVLHYPHYEATNKMVNRQFRAKKVAVEEAQSQGNWSRFVFLHERPYRLDALEEVLYTHMLDEPEAVWSLISSVWVDSENIYQNASSWRDIWETDIEGREQYVMDVGEQVSLAALPDIIPVFRGVSHEESVHGMSWTTDRDKAIWFARRFATMEDRKPLLVSATINKKDVLAHFLGRGENEIVGLPESANVLKVKSC